MSPQLATNPPRNPGNRRFAIEKGRTTSRLFAHSGADSLLYPSGPRRYRVSLASFFQVNRFLLDTLVQLGHRRRNGRHRMGPLCRSRPVFAPSGRDVLCDHRCRILALRRPRSPRKPPQVPKHRVIASDTAAFLRQALQHRQAAPDLVVVDPPRAGLLRDVTSALGKIRPRKITYVSCDPATLGRDLAALLESGYRLRKIHLLDLFPQTYHIESVTHLSLD